MIRAVWLAASAALLTTLAVVAADFIQHFQSGGPLMRSTFAWWLMAFPGSLTWFQGAIEGALGQAFWDLGVATILTLPAAIMLALKAVFLFAAGVAIRNP
jgi:hypothetical protein